MATIKPEDLAWILFRQGTKYNNTLAERYWPDPEVREVWVEKAKLLIESAGEVPSA